MIALTLFRLAAFARSHRVVRALLPVLVLLALAYGVRAPLGQEVTALTDTAVLLVPLLAWSARSLLDTEPDQQRAISATAVGSPSREVAAGLLAALVVTTAFAALAVVWGLLLGVSELPSRGALAAAVALHALSALAGTALGALTSRPILPSPALSIMMLVLGFLAMLLVSLSPAAWLTVPLGGWMRAAADGLLTEGLPWLAVPSLLWPLLGLAAYARLRRARP
ncbi:hypothetical protein [Nonomuraea roseola]|uniref:ABC transporter permease n=1 Tax=Nonomuraea roseola TaxID=46179 RepID=A0ABV5QC61_9ACTN